MDQKPIAPFEAPAPERNQYHGPLVLPQRAPPAPPRPGFAAAGAVDRVAAQVRPGVAARARDRFAGARPVREWPQAWML